MTPSLQNQKVYYPRNKVVRPASCTLFAFILLLIALVFKIWVKVQIVDVGYEIADLKKVNNSLGLSKRELELQKSLLLRSDKMHDTAIKIGLKQLAPEKVVYLE